MIPFAYLDSSVLLRRIFGQQGALEEWPEIERGIVSALVEVECLRTIDRLRVSSPPGAITEQQLAIRREAVYKLLGPLDAVDITRPILARAAQPLPTSLGTLDAVHLATALSWREETGSDLVLATHDGALGRAARSCGLPVIGL